MAGVVNIRRDVDDKFYRYRMPLLLTKIEGKGNGIKTVVPNMSDVAHALSRPPSYPTKFFGCELGAQTSFDEKADRYIVNGAHDATRLRELLDVFIDKFVLCGSCKNPETDLIITKDIIRDCKACGERTPIDMRHKLTTFILRNPPKVSKKCKKVKETATGENGGGSSPAEESEAAGGESDDELTKRIKSEAAKLATDPTSTGDDWAVDTSAKAVKARVKALEGSMQTGLVLNGDDESDDEVNSPYDQIGRWVEENRDTITVDEVCKRAELLGIAEKRKTVQVLVQAVFTANIVSEITKFAPIFVKMTTSERHQKALLGGIERFVGVTHSDLIPAVPKILMGFYQNSVLEEDVVKHWAARASRKYVDKETNKEVREASVPFLKWLEEAEEEEE